MRDFIQALPKTKAAATAIIAIIVDIRTSDLLMAYGYSKFNFM